MCVCVDGGGGGGEAKKGGGGSTSTLFRGLRQCQENRQCQETRHSRVREDLVVMDLYIQSMPVVCLCVCVCVGGGGGVGGGCRHHRFLGDIDNVTKIDRVRNKAL